MVQVRPAERDERGVSFLPYASSAVERFAAPDGNPCAVYPGHVKENLIGWAAPTAADAACSHDTFYDGLQPAVLELRWRSLVPADGTFDLVTLGYAVGAWGRVVTRSSHYGDYFARAEVVIDAQSAHCSTSWSKALAVAKATGPIERVAVFSGWIEIPDLVVADCRKDDPLDVRVRFVGESNRGRVDVDWFGFSAVNDDDANRIFGLRPHGGLR